MQIPKGIHPAGEVSHGHFLASQHDGGHLGAIDFFDKTGQGTVVPPLLDLKGSQHELCIDEISGVTVTVNEIAHQAADLDW